jgi:potassium voltage-gated channel Shab-related subfamily B protein 2
VISVISIVFVVVSTVGMTLNTIPSIQHRNELNEPIDNPKLALIEAICISWFTIEYLLRFAGNYDSTKIIFSICSEKLRKLLRVFAKIARKYFLQA